MALRGAGKLGTAKAHGLVRGRHYLPALGNAGRLETFQNSSLPGLQGASGRLGTGTPSVCVLSWLRSLTEQAPGERGTLGPLHQPLLLQKGKLRPKDRNWNGLN